MDFSLQRSPARQRSSRGARARRCRCACVARPPVTVYKDASCGCCKKWVEHMQASGFTVDAHDSADMDAVKDHYGVPSGVRSCHTALVGNYVVEGHVPAADVDRLLKEQPKVAGLAVPGNGDGKPGHGGLRVEAVRGARLSEDRRDDAVRLAHVARGALLHHRRGPVRARGCAGARRLRGSPSMSSSATAMSAAFGIRRIRTRRSTRARTSSPRARNRRSMISRCRRTIPTIRRGSRFSTTFAHSRTNTICASTFGSTHRSTRARPVGDAVGGAALHGRGAAATTA